MSTVWMGMGVIKWPISFAFLAVWIMTLWSGARLAGDQGVADGRTKALVDAVLFWGAFAAISGVLGTLVGIILAAQAVEAAGEVTTSLLWGGIKVALLSSAVGFVVLGLSSLLWFPLQFRWRVLSAKEDELR